MSVTSCSAIKEVVIVLALKRDILSLTIEDYLNLALLLNRSLVDLLYKKFPNCTKARGTINTRNMSKNMTSSTLVE